MPGTWQQKRSFSPAVITKGNQTIVWVAGHTGAVTDEGRSLAGDFDAQFHQVFKNIGETLEAAESTLSDIVTMTVFLIDARYTTRMTELRLELFGGHSFPASAAITVSGFAKPEIMLEIQCVAVRS
jgi:2-iminobutanoate/2-iminopropanoate deaminase